MTDPQIPNHSSGRPRSPSTINQLPRLQRNRQEMYQPFQVGLHNNASFRTGTIYSSINITTLESSERINLQNRYIDLQLLRLICGANTGNATTFNRRTRVSAQTHFKRLYLLRVVNITEPQDHDKLVYIMETTTKNKYFWTDNTNNRDNGNVTIGSFIRVQVPHKITQYMRNDIPMINSDWPFILLKTPKILFFYI